MYDIIHLKRFFLISDSALHLKSKRYRLHAVIKLFFSSQFQKKYFFTAHVCFKYLVHFWKNLSTRYIHVNLK